MKHISTNATPAAQDGLDQMANLAEDILARCRAAGASQAEVGVDDDRGINVNVRMGEVETIEHTRDRGLSLTVYFGQRKGSASTADLAPASIAATIDYACAIARYTEEDPAAGLADPARMAKVFPDLDLWHPWALSPEHAIELGIACEAAGRAVDPRIDNSDGASVASGDSLSIYANSHGFTGRERGTHHSISCALIAEDDAGMQRDYWYTSARHAGDLESVESVGRIAAERTLRRLGAQRLSTRECPVLFAPELSRGLIGSFVSAVSGGALYRRASFLLDQAGQQLFPSWFAIAEEPHLLRGLGSCSFDSEGVATSANHLVRDGVLQRYVMGSYSARKLGLTSTANAGGTHNLRVASNAGTLEQIMRSMGRGLLVTELMGQGVNIVTGDYSRGAAGFWIENGEPAYAVEEITIAGKLREMLAGIAAIGSEVDRRSSILTGPILIDRMTIAGA